MDLEIEIKGSVYEKIIMGHVTLHIPVVSDVSEVWIDFRDQRYILLTYRAYDSSLWLFTTILPPPKLISGF